MSSNKDFLPSSSPVSSICASKIIAILFLFMMNCYKSSFQECITIIVLKVERTRNQPPYCLLQLQEKMAFHLPRSGCLGTPVTLPRSLYGRTDVRWRQNQNFSYQRVTKFSYPWCSACSACSAIKKVIGEPLGKPNKYRGEGTLWWTSITIMGWCYTISLLLHVAETA